jgi:hypothetical protein
MDMICVHFQIDIFLSYISTNGTGNGPKAYREPVPCICQSTLSVGVRLLFSLR